MTRATKVKNPLVTLLTLYFLKEAVTLSNHRICIIRRIRYAIVMRWTIWYHLHNFKNVKNTQPATLLKLTRFLNCTNGTKSRNAPQLSQSNENASFTSLHKPYICCAVEHLTCQAMMSQLVLNLCLYQHASLKRGNFYHLHDSCMYQQVNNSSFFRSLEICFATTPVSICVVFVRPHRYLFIILESENMFLNSLTSWSAVFKGRFCLTRKP